LYLKKEVPILTEDSILVEYNYLTTQYLPPVINGVRVKQVEINKKLFKKHKVVKFFRIVPLRYTNTVFNITIIEFEARFEKNKNNIAMVNKNGEKFEFVYDCTKRQLVSMF
jgi:hypothetical protein